MINNCADTIIENAQKLEFSTDSSSDTVSSDTFQPFISEPDQKSAPIRTRSINFAPTAQTHTKPLGGFPPIYKSVNVLQTKSRNYSKTSDTIPLKDILNISLD